MKAAVLDDVRRLLQEWICEPVEQIELRYQPSLLPDLGWRKTV